MADRSQVRSPEEVRQDYLQKFLFEDWPIKGTWVSIDETWREIRSRAQPPREVMQLLGQTLCASALLTSNIKFRGAVSLQIQNAKTLRLVLGQCTDQGLLRGIAHDRGRAGHRHPGHSILSINLEPADEGHPYQGIVALEHDELATALETYFAQSEQLGTRFWLVADDHKCVGLMMQRMPGFCRDPDAWDRVCRSSATLTPGEMLTFSGEELCQRSYPDDLVRLFGPHRLRFGCRCSRERVSRVLKSLGQEEVLSIVRERGSVEIHCEYCGQKYDFDPVDSRRLFDLAILPMPGSSGVH